jgi:hypothetical protein
MQRTLLRRSRILVIMIAMPPEMQTADRTSVTVFPDFAIGSAVDCYASSDLMSS